MNCNQFKNEMNNFINNSIDDDIMEDFIAHYKSCKECNEELEIYYMINKTFAKDVVDGDTVSIPDSYDFKERLAKKVAFYDEMIYQRYKRKFLINLAVIGTELISLTMAIYFVLWILGGHNV